MYQILPHAFASLRVSAPVATRPIQPVTISSTPSSPLPQISQHSPASHRHGAEHLLSATGRKDGSNPMFGQPSFSPHSDGTDDTRKETEQMEMDWEPSPRPSNISGGRRRPPGLDDEDQDPEANSNSRHDWDSFAVNRQRMFPNQTTRDETGLESLIAGWGIDGNGAGTTTRQTPISMILSGTPNPPILVSSAPPSMLIVGSKINRAISCLLGVFRCVALVTFLLLHTPRDQVIKIDTIVSSIEIGVILMSFLLPAKSEPSPRTSILVVELLMRYYHLFGRQHLHGKDTKTEVMSAQWMLCLIWLQWAMLNATRAML